jgi:hypothetical protein
MKCFYFHKERHVKKDCLVWKCICEEETTKAKPKVGVNVTMVDWDRPLVDICVTSGSKKVPFTDGEQGNIETSPMKGR